MLCFARIMPGGDQFPARHQHGTHRSLPLIGGFLRFRQSHAHPFFVFARRHPNIPTAASRT